MSTGSIIALVVSLLVTATCLGAGFFLLLFFVVGVVMLRRRGQQNVTAKEAVQAGAERVSQVFMRTGSGLQPLDDDDDSKGN